MGAAWYGWWHSGRNKGRARAYALCVVLLGLEGGRDAGGGGQAAQLQHAQHRKHFLRGGRGRDGLHHLQDTQQQQQ